MKLNLPLTKNKNRLSRTFESTLFEAAFVILALFTWGFVVWLVSHAPERVPVHFDFSGNADGWASPSVVILQCALSTVMGGLAMFAAYFPSSVHFPFPIETPRQIQLAMRMVRILALLLLLMDAAIALSMLKTFHPWPILICTGIILATCILFCILVYRARKS